MLRPWRAVLYGKLAAHGDFISRGQSENERAAWDRWTAEGVLAAETALGEGFAQAHDAAPPWAFIGGSCGFGEGWRVGALAPSRDKAGRRFVIMAAVEDLACGEALALGAQIGAMLCDVIQRMRAELSDADAARDMIAALATGDSTPLPEAFATLLSPSAGGVWWRFGEGAFGAAIETGAMPSSALLVRMFESGRDDWA